MLAACVLCPLMSVLWCSPGTSATGRQPDSLCYLMRMSAAHAREAAVHAREAVAAQAERLAGQAELRAAQAELSAAVAELQQVLEAEVDVTHSVFTAAHD